MTRRERVHPTRLAMLTALVLVSGSGWPQSAPRAARSVVDLLCARDFGAQPSRDSLVVYSSGAERRAANPLKSEWFPLVAWTWDPLVIVTGYRVLDVETSDSTGIARVKFEVVGRSHGRDQIEPTKPRSVVDTLRLVRRDSRWWVLNPPLARVSVNAEIGAYSRELASVDSSWFDHASRVQLDVYSSQFRALIALKRIAAEGKLW